MRIFGAPRQYIQGPGAIAQAARIAAMHHGTPLIIADALVWPSAREAMTGPFEVSPPVLTFSGEITPDAIAELEQEARALVDFGAPVLIFGVGGGKTLDAAKAVVLRLGGDFVSVPTAASNDSPTGRAIAIYDDHHKLAKIENLPRNPEAVIADTALIAKAPARLLRSGIGDAIAKKFEAIRARDDGGLNYFGTRPLLSAIAIAERCYDVLRAHGEAAMKVAGTGEVTDDLEAVVEASILMAGIAWESGGVSLSHALVRGIARTPGAEQSLHGEHVAYGLLGQLAIEGRDDDFIIDLMRFYKAIGQPVTLRGLGAHDDGQTTIEQIAAWVLDGPQGGNLIVSATCDEMVAALVRVERLARDGRIA